MCSDRANIQVFLSRQSAAPVDSLQGGDGLRLLRLVLQRPQADDAVLFALQVRLIEQLHVRAAGIQYRGRSTKAIAQSCAAPSAGQQRH